jgi:hypothetical protein
LWQAKVVQALARRRAEALAKKRAEAEARARQAQQPTPPKSSSPLAKLVKMGLFIIALGGVGPAGGSVQVVESPMSVATEMVNDVFDTPNNSGGLDFCGVMAIICPVGGAGGIAGEGGGGSGGGSLVEWILLAVAAILTADASSDTQVLPYPQIGPMPYNPDDEYLDEIPLDRILRIPWADFMNPEPPDSDEPDRCSREEMESRIAGKTVAQVVGVSDIYPVQDAVTTVFVIDYAVAMCQYGGYGSFPPIEWYKGVTRNSIYQGHTRFVASRVAGVIPIFEPEPVDDLSEYGADLEPMINWENVRWAGPPRW